MCDDCGRVVSVVGGHCRACAVHHPEVTQLWAQIDERAKRARAQREASQAGRAAEAEERRRAALMRAETPTRGHSEEAAPALAVAVACCLAICAVGTVVLNIGTVITWLIGIALVLSVLAVIWCVLSRGIFFISS